MLVLHALPTSHDQEPVRLPPVGLPHAPQPQLMACPWCVASFPQSWLKPTKENLHAETTCKTRKHVNVIVPTSPGAPSTFRRKSVLLQHQVSNRFVLQSWSTMPNCVHHSFQLVLFTHEQLLLLMSSLRFCFSFMYMTLIVFAAIHVYVLAA